jgi:hypothetical protein
MERKPTTLNLVIDAALKLDARSGEWQNVMAFIHSCYCGRVRGYDLDAALGSLEKLSKTEEHALISWAMMVDEVTSASRGAA